MLWKATYTDYYYVPNYFFGTIYHVHWSLYFIVHYRNLKPHSKKQIA